MRAHAYPYDRHLGDFVIRCHFTCADIAGYLLENRLCFAKFVAMHGKGEVGRVIHRHVLHNHVDFDVRSTDRAQNLEGHTGGIRHAADGQFGFITIERDTGDDGLFH